MSSNDEKRRSPRADLPLLVQIRYAASEMPQTVYAINISESGLFLDVDDGKPLGTRVFVQITSPDGNQLLRGEGRVVRRPSGGGCGIALRGFKADARALLAQLVARSGGAA